MSMHLRISIGAFLLGSVIICAASCTESMPGTNRVLSSDISTDSEETTEHSDSPTNSDSIARTESDNFKLDTMSDSNNENETDTVSDSTSDTVYNDDVSSDNSNLGGDTGIVVESDSTIDSMLDSRNDTASDSAFETDTVTTTDSLPDANTNSDADTDSSDTEADSNIDTEEILDSETATECAADTETEPDSSTDTATETETGVVPVDSDTQSICAVYTDPEIYCDESNRILWHLIAMISINWVEAYSACLAEGLRLPTLSEALAIRSDEAHPCYWDNSIFGTSCYTLWLYDGGPFPPADQKTFDYGNGGAMLQNYLKQKFAFCVEDIETSEP